MKYALTFLIVLGSLKSISQTPYLWVRFKMDSLKASTDNYDIKMKICHLVKPSDKGDWLITDTSRIEFISLSAKDIECRDYLGAYEGVEYVSGHKPVLKHYEFEYSNQTFAFENILVFKIMNKSSAALQLPMYIVLPIKHKSFVTGIRITDVVFDQGKVIFIESVDAKKEGMSITLKTSLAHSTGKNTSDFRLKEILDK
jgi:hypothetical protein